MEPDFFAVEVPKEQWTWFIFPWNRHEDLRTLLPKTLYEPKSEAEVRRAFKVQFKIDVSPTLVKTTSEGPDRDGRGRRSVRNGPGWNHPSRA